MDLAATLDDLGFDRQGLVDAAMLCGTDFNEGVRGIGPKTAVKAVREHGDLWGVLDARGVEIPNAEAIRELFMDPPATDVDVDTAVNPDVDAARERVRRRRVGRRRRRGRTRVRTHRGVAGSDRARPVDVRRPEDRREHTFYFLVVRRVTYTCRGPRFDLGSRP